MAEPSPRPSNHDNPAVQHELSDASVRGIMLFGVWLTLLAIVIYVTVWILYQYLAPGGTPSELLPQQPAASRLTPSKPQLQVEPKGEFAQLRASEDQILRSYGWIDREKEIVRIPIERAMEIIVQDGLPTAKQAGAEPKALGKNPKKDGQSNG